MPLDLYVFYLNPLNYVAMAVDPIYTAFFLVEVPLDGEESQVL